MAAMAQFEDRLAQPSAPHLVHETPDEHEQTECSPLGRLHVDVVGDSLDVIRAQLLAEDRHGVLAVR
eukprot:CAMPEP_0204196788 /NCGR_PEP_ID=MMETSP0361-20130328/64091_1 /ASSEMBLY_ACC=CAM_ASM_000343 /TAXON_ID=268821 /ORGANISM="Scrippsiella Hangoei, Strain SHTV-5" /LENGTH=66 /DNA_ID=CAMNT_0051158601 /DNA_START=36 /DNA_END=233 /DNA_ORIENTATION=-